MLWLLLHTLNISAGAISALCCFALPPLLRRSNFTMSRFFAKPGDSSSEEESVASSSESESESSEDEKPQAKKKVVAEEPKVKKGNPCIVSQSCLPLSACMFF